MNKRVHRVLFLASFFFVLSLININSLVSLFKPSGLVAQAVCYYVPVSDKCYGTCDGGTCKKSGSGCTCEKSTPTTKPANTPVPTTRPPNTPVPTSRPKTDCGTQDGAKRSNGARWCDVTGRLAKRCDGGSVKTEYCSKGCSGGQCSSTPVGCDEGNTPVYTTKCVDGTRYKICESDNKWRTYTCATGKVCNSNNGRCENPPATPPPATPPPSKCTAKTTNIKCGGTYGSLTCPPTSMLQRVIKSDCSGSYRCTSMPSTCKTCTESVDDIGCGKTYGSTTCVPSAMLQRVINKDCSGSYRCDANNAACGKRPVGADCSSDGDCESDVCVGGKCTSGTNGSRCFTNADCRSDSYCAVAFGLAPGLEGCQRKGGAGAFCGFNYQCLSGKCGGDSKCTAPETKDCDSRKDGEKWCDGTYLRECTSGKVSFIKCANGCVTGSGGATCNTTKNCCCSGECSITSECWSVPESCPAGTKTCSSSYCEGLSTCDGHKEGEKWCDGDYVKECKAGRISFIKCANGCLSAGGNVGCKVTVCNGHKEGEKWCSANYLKECKSGEISYVRCENGCVSSGGNAICRSGPTTTPSTKCVNPGGDCSEIGECCDVGGVDYECNPSYFHCIPGALITPPPGVSCVNPGEDCSGGKSCCQVGGLVFECDSSLKKCISKTLPTAMPTSKPGEPTSGPGGPTSKPSGDKCKKCPNGSSVTARPDYDCNGKTDLSDFTSWFDDYKLGSKNMYADYNCDGKVNMSDFTFWYDEYK